MGNAFIERDSVVFRQNTTFVTGFNVIADQPFNIGSPTSINSTLNTYNQINPIGGISGYLTSGNLINSNIVFTTGQQTISAKNFNSLDFNQTVIDIPNLKLFDNQNPDDGQQISVDWGNRQFFYNDGTVSMDWGLTIVYDNNGDIPSMNWANRNLLDNNGNIAIDWSFNRLTGILSGNWITNSLNISGGNVITDKIYRAGQQSIGNLSTTQAVLFSSALANTNYAVSLSFSGTLASAVTPSVSNKTTGGFTLNLSAGIAGGAVLDYTAILNK